MFAYGHHGAGAASSDEDAAGVSLVLAESVGYHVGDGVAVAAAIVGQGRLGRDVPASALVRGFRVDDDEAVLVGELGVRRAGVVGLGGAGAVVDGNDDGRLRSKLVGNVDIHLRLSLDVSIGIFTSGPATGIANVGRVGTIVGHLLQRSTNGAADKRESGGEKGQSHGVNRCYEGFLGQGMERIEGMVIWAVQAFKKHFA